MYTCIYVYKYDVSSIYTCEHINSDLRRAATKIPSMCAHGKGNQSLSLRPSDLPHHISNEITRYPVRCDSGNSVCSSKCFVGVPSTKWYLHSISPPDLATLAA